MRTTRRLGGILAAVLMAVTAASGQPPAAPGAAPPAAVPGAPALPGAPAAAAPGVGAAGTAGAAGAAPAAAAPAAAPPRNIWSFFMMTPEQKLAHQQNSALCRIKFCNSKIGQFVNNMLMPAGAVTGGLLGPVCPSPLTPNPADLAKAPTSPQGAAARIKAEEAQAKAKVEAIEYLATVPCHYYPEAEAALIVGLRAEKNECVRLAAAKALATGCCCTAKTVKALVNAVNPRPDDKLPSELSERVRAFAFVALERCLRKCVEAEPDPPAEPPAGVKQAVYEALTPGGVQTDPTTPVVMAGYFAPSGGDPPAKVYEKAREVLRGGLRLSPQTMSHLTGPRNVRDAVVPGLENVRPGNLLDMLDVRGSGARPAWVATLPKPLEAAAPAPEPVVPVAVKPAAGPAWPKPRPVSAVPPPFTPISAAPTPDPRTGRGNLVNIFQDAQKR